MRQATFALALFVPWPNSPSVVGAFSPQRFPDRPRVAVLSPTAHRYTIKDVCRHEAKCARLSPINAMPSFLPIIQPSDSWGNWMVLVGNAALAQSLGKSTAIGRLLGPPVSAMALTFLMATVGVLSPGGSDAAKSLQVLSLQIATPAVLMGADLREASSRCGPLLVSFLLASCATVLACVFAWYLLGGPLSSALGPDGLKIAAALMAKNIGGGLNYIAVCTSLGSSPMAVAAGLCVDNIFALIYFPATSFLSRGHDDLPMLKNENKQSKLGILDLEGDNDNSKVEQQVAKEAATSEESITVDRMTLVLFLSAMLLWLGQNIGGSTGALPVCTLLTVLFASRAPSKFVESLQPAAQLVGTLALYVFFSTAGAPGLAVADSVRASVLPLGLFLTLLYGIHGLFLWVARLGLREVSPLAPALEVPRLLCASSAAIGGPATAVALAKAAQWESLIVPSLLVGNLGYAIATFLGLAYHAILLKSQW